MTEIVTSFLTDYLLIADSWFLLLVQYYKNRHVQFLLYKLFSLVFDFYFLLHVNCNPENVAYLLFL